MAGFTLRNRCWEQSWAHLCKFAAEMRYGSKHGDEKWEWRSLTRDAAGRTAVICWKRVSEEQSTNREHKLCKNIPQHNGRVC